MRMKFGGKNKSKIYDGNNQTRCALFGGVGGGE